MTDESSSKKGRSSRRLFKSPFFGRRRRAELEASLDARLSDQDARLNELHAHLRRLEERLEAASDHLLSLPSAAVRAPIAVRIAPTVANASELCFFVSYARESRLKEHVGEHIAALSKQGIAVVLIVNTAHAPDEFHLDAAVAAMLSGCFIRANLGFDFAAWAHAYSIVGIPGSCKRLYLANDSIVGPLEARAHAEMMARIRASTADLIGLTENRLPRPHLQSYFLVVANRLLRAGLFDELMRGIVNLPTKEAVIAQYETQITRYLRSSGFVCSAVFAKLPTDAALTDDTFFSWEALIDSGFPFIKASRLKANSASPGVARVVPERFRARIAGL